MRNRWISDDTVNERWPHYTRANAAEVGPEPFSPLGWSFGMRDACRPGITDGWVALGVLSEDEVARHHPDGTATFGGWMYNNMSLGRMVGVRIPGGDPDLMERQSFGHYDGVPHYVAHPEDPNEAQTQKMGAVLQWILGGSGIDDLPAAAEEARRLRRERPAFSTLTDAALVERARSCFPLIRLLWRMHMQASIGSSIASGAVQQIAAAVGRADDYFSLFSAIGDVVSADASIRLWELGRVVRSSPRLMTEFDQGAEGLSDRLARVESVVDDGGVGRFHDGFASVLDAHGHRGPNEWDLCSPSWDVEPGLPLSMIERLRFQDDDRDPTVAAQHAARRREELTESIADLLAGDEAAHGAFLAGIRAGAVFMASREQTKSGLIMSLNEMRLALRELGVRRVAQGVLEEAGHVFMLLSEELDVFVESPDPARWRALLSERAAQHRALYDLEPPFFIDGAKGVLSLDAWPQKQLAETESAAVGEVLQGAAGAPGVVEGCARIVLDPRHADHLQPGDIMVVETTDPSWTPLFLSVAGVVSNIGAIISHAAIVSRELGVPCVVACERATERIPEGAVVRIDGSSGTVTIVAAG